MVGILVAFAGDTTINKILNISADIRPNIIKLEELEYVTLARMTSSQVIMFELQDMSVEIARSRTRVGNINTMID